MMIFKTIDEVRAYVKGIKLKGKSVGFVPTMGYLHEGHMSLIRRAVDDNDFIVCSIFVNPTQFGPSEDFERYPRDIERDSSMLRDAGCDVLFIPSGDEMYPPGFYTHVEVNKLTDYLCGALRPSHFKGVTTVVNKLFNIVSPDRAYFGQKDAQQAIIISRMTEDLNMDIDIVVCPIVRESDGLAMSSRNVYLSPEERSQALVLVHSLTKARTEIEKGQRDAHIIKAMINDMISKMPLANIVYISVVNGNTLENMEFLSGRVLIATAVRFGNTRLIDNIYMEVF